MRGQPYWPKQIAFVDQEDIDVAALPAVDAKKLRSLDGTLLVIRESGEPLAVVVPEELFSQRLQCVQETAAAICALLGVTDPETKRKIEGLLVT